MMSKGKIRKGEEDTIPLDKPVWGIIARNKGGKIEEQAIYFSQSDNRFLIDDFESMKEGDALYVVWHGSWNTDVFRCDPKKIIERIRKEEEP
jgi:hypothetical protein